MLLAQNHYIDEDDKKKEEGEEDKANVMNERFASLGNSSVPSRKKRKIKHEEKVPKFHYVFISSLSGLLKNQTSKNNRKKEICDRCLIYFHNKIDRVKHEQDCLRINLRLN